MDKKIEIHALLKTYGISHWDIDQAAKSVLENRKEDAKKSIISHFEQFIILCSIKYSDSDLEFIVYHDSYDDYESFFVSHDLALESLVRVFRHSCVAINDNSKFKIFLLDDSMYTFLMAFIEYRFTEKYITDMLDGDC